MDWVGRRRDFRFASIPQVFITQKGFKVFTDLNLRVHLRGMNIFKWSFQAVEVAKLCQDLGLTVVETLGVAKTRLESCKCDTGHQTVNR